MNSAEMYPVGTVCRAIATGLRCRDSDGLLCLVVAHVRGEPGEYEVFFENGEMPRPGKFYELGHENLRPIEREVANTIATWSSCIWVPDGVVV